MTLDEKLLELTKNGVITIEYGKGTLAHSTAICNGVPMLLVCGLNKDCRTAEITADNLECVIEAIPFRDQRTLDCFKKSIAEIEQLMVKCNASEG